MSEIGSISSCSSRATMGALSGLRESAVVALSCELYLGSASVPGSSRAYKGFLCISRVDEWDLRHVS